LQTLPSAILSHAASEFANVQSNVFTFILGRNTQTELPYHKTGQLCHISFSTLSFFSKKS
jgi:hypothetical protein